MAIRQLRIEDDPILRKNCKEVKAVDEKIKGLLDVLKMVNPVITASEGTQDCVEGCLSFPNQFGKTIRPLKVTVDYLDENGEAHTIIGEKDLAKCFCHEIDHLNGEVFIDKVTEFI